MNIKKYAQQQKDLDLTKHVETEQAKTDHITGGNQSARYGHPMSHSTTFSPANILALQRSVGNQMVRRFLNQAHQSYIRKRSGVLLSVILNLLTQ